MLGTLKLQWTVAARCLVSAASLYAATDAARAYDVRLGPIGSGNVAGRLQPVHVPSAVFGSATAESPANDCWQSQQHGVDLPHGNPLTDPLDFSPAESELFADAAEGHLHRLSLLEAGLLASGVDDLAAIVQAREQFAAARDELRNRIANTSELAKSDSSLLHRVQLIHQILHQRLLRGGYNASATNLVGTLQTGIYNCASATLLFVALADEFDVSAQAIELPGHVRAIVDCGGQRYEIEVTCPVWSDAIRRWEDSGTPTSVLSRNEIEYGTLTPALSRRERGREVPPLGLVAMIYYNRGIDAFNERRFAESLAANRRALLLDPENAIARANLLAAVNNWALTLSDAGAFAESERLLADGQRFDPSHLAFAHNAAHVMKMWTKMQTAAGAAQKTGPAMPSL
jgi:tetratricopeptide (TPR) repeat protein